MKQETVNRLVKYVFSQDEKRELGCTLAEKHVELATEESRAKEAAAQFKSSTTALQGAIQSIAQKLNSGYEFRNVRCDVERDYKEGKVRVYRLDTGECVEERDMTQEDRQMRVEEAA